MIDYINYDDMARLEYGRLLWRNPVFRQQLLNHWSDPRHPYRERFLQQRELVEFVLQSGESDTSIEARLAARGTSVRAVAREIPPVFGSFWHR